MQAIGLGPHNLSLGHLSIRHISVQGTHVRNSILIGIMHAHRLTDRLTISALTIYHPRPALVQDDVRLNLFWGALALSLSRLDTVEMVEITTKG